MEAVSLSYTLDSCIQRILTLSLKNTTHRNSEIGT